jgi:regulator of protease activity HflC (stomatin/prohibitin superfamily)
MLGIQYLKTNPTHYVIHYVSGRKHKVGAGLSFFYFKPSSSIVVVPVGSADVPFIFNELSQDYQPLTVQGELTYRIFAPELVASLLNYTVDSLPTRYLSDDPQKLPQRLINLLQVMVRADIQKLPLRDAIKSSEAVAAAVLEKMQSSEALKSLGVEVLSLAIQAIKPIPEMARALEAEAREELLRRADQAIYDRRNAAVEQERKIKENELNTEIAVEEKKRQIRETKVEADLAVERKQQEVRQTQLNGQINLEGERKKLVLARKENVQTEAEAQAYVMEASLRALKDLEPAVLQALTVQSADPRLMVSMAMKELAQNAARIGTLNISPDLLELLMQDKKTPQPARAKGE